MGFLIELRGRFARLAVLIAGLVGCTGEPAPVDRPTSVIVSAAPLSETSAPKAPRPRDVSPRHVQPDSVDHGGIRESRDLDEALSRAKVEHRPAMVLFYAQWAVASMDLLRNVFKDPQVTAQATRFVQSTVDVTDEDAPGNLDLQRRYKVQGLPLILLLDSEGIERRRILVYLDGPALAAEMANIH